MTIQLNTNHSEKNRVEAFLRAVKEKLEQVPFNWKALQESDRIVEAIKLTSINRSLNIIVIFVKAYEDADLIARANFIKVATRWGQNGSIMYVVESADQDSASQIASIFAGKE